MYNTETELAKVSQLAQVQAWRQQVMRTILRVSVVVAALAVITALYDAYVGRAFW